MSIEESEWDAQLRALFDLCDDDGSGKITVEKLARVDPQLSDEEVRRLFLTLDEEVSPPCSSSISSREPPQRCFDDVITGIRVHHLREVR